MKNDLTLWCDYIEKLQGEERSNKNLGNALTQFTKFINFMARVHLSRFSQQIRGTHGTPDRVGDA
jgi:hypothetical protein